MQARGFVVYLDGLRRSVAEEDELEDGLVDKEAGAGQNRSWQDPLAVIRRLVGRGRGWLFWHRQHVCHSDTFPQLTATEI